jgi:hypothetical protein
MCININMSNKKVFVSCELYSELHCKFASYIIKRRLGKFFNPSQSCAVHPDRDETGDWELSLKLMKVMDTAGSTTV